MIFNKTQKLENMARKLSWTSTIRGASKFVLYYFINIYFFLTAFGLIYVVPSSCCRNCVPVFLGRNPLFLPLRSGYCTVWQDTTSYALIPAPDTPYVPLLYRLIICCRQIQRHCESCCWKYCRDSDGWYTIAIFLLNTLDLIKECWANMDQGIQMAPLFCRV